MITGAEGITRTRRAFVAMAKLSFERLKSKISLKLLHLRAQKNTKQSSKLFQPLSFIIINDAIVFVWVLQLRHFCNSRIGAGVILNLPAIHLNFVSLVFKSAFSAFKLPLRRRWHSICRSCRFSSWFSLRWKGLRKGHTNSIKKLNFTNYGINYESKMNQWIDVN